MCVAGDGPGRSRGALAFALVLCALMLCVPHASSFMFCVQGLAHAEGIPADKIDAEMNNFGPKRALVSLLTPLAAGKSKAEPPLRALNALHAAEGAKGVAVLAG